MNLPLSYLMLKIGMSFDSTFYVSISLSSIALVIRYCLLRSYVEYSVKELVLDFTIPIVILTIVSNIVPLVIYNYMEQGLFRLLIVCVTSWTSIALVSWICVLDKNEKSLLLRIKGKNEDSYYCR